tara:strand:+ start:151 stop:513 length:363 start_codon:yes stop_codon:yes gene_type:complete
MWESKRSRFKRPDRDFYSISNKLKSQNKINENFEIMLSSLTLEEIIALRLELAAKVVNFKLYGLNLWQNLPELVKDAVLKYVYSAARTKGEMAAFLGLDRSTLKKLLKKHNTSSYFDKSQ